MLDNKLTIYKPLDLQQPAIPDRSILYSLEPIGIGTPYVEGLTSYVARLAKAHGIFTGKLVAGELASLIKGKNDTGIKASGSHNHLVYDASEGAMNGGGATAAKFVQALEKRTLRNDLRFLTMLTWADVLPLKGLLRAMRAWCPVCYEESRKTQQVIDPLIWTLDLVTVCPRHYQRLQTQCPHCYKQLPRLAWRFQPGYCSKCDGWLGASSEADSSESDALPAKQLMWQLFVADSIGELVSAASYLSSIPSREKVAKNLNACVNQITQGNMSAFARLFEQSPHWLKRWCRGEQLIQLGTVLQICHYLELSLPDFLAGEIVTANLPTNSPKLVDCFQSKPKHHSRKFRRHLNCDEMQQGLQAALNESPPSSLKEVATRLGETSPRLYRYFPENMILPSGVWLMNYES